MTDKELRTLDEMLTNLEIWSTWNKTFANEMIGICSKMWNLLANRKTENSSEKPNNCEHITEDGVTCAKYPACDDCLDNPLNKLKGSERLVKGSEQTEPTISKMEQVDEPKTQMKTQNSNLTFEKRKCVDCNFLTYMFGKTWCNIKCENPHDKVCDRFKPKDEPQTERSE